VWLLPALFLFGFAIRTYIWYYVLPEQPSFGKAYYMYIYYPTWSRLDGLLTGAWLIAHDDHQYEMQGAIFGYPAISIAYGALVLAALSPSSVLYKYSS